MFIAGYGICGRGESRRYLRQTLDEFKRLCDHTIILLNNAGKEEKNLIASYGFDTVEDNREWGTNQHKIKRDFIENHVANLAPDLTVCLDMDEAFVNVERDDLERLDPRDAYYVYVVNLWGKGYRPDWSFWNVRVWGWHREMDNFFAFEHRPLHCGLAPKWCYALNKHAPFVLEHYGLKLKQDRQKKIRRYQKYDPEHKYRESGYYKALTSDTYKPYDRDEIVRAAEEHVASLKQPNGKVLPFQEEKKRIMIMREYDGFTFDVPEEEVQHYLRQTFKGYGFIQV